MLQTGFGRDIGAEGILGRERPSDSGDLETEGRRDRVGAQSRCGGTQAPFGGVSSSHGSISTDLGAVVKSPSSLRSGCGGIRTPGGLSPTAVFKTAAFDHSATHPDSAGEDPPAPTASEPRPIPSVPLFASPEGSLIRVSVSGHPASPPSPAVHVVMGSPRPTPRCAGAACGFPQYRLAWFGVLSGGFWRTITDERRVIQS